MKKKIAVLLSPWSVDYVIAALSGMQKVCKKNNIDLYVFAAYKFDEPSGGHNTTGFAIFDLINYKDYDGIVILPNLFNDEERVKLEHQRILDSGVPAVSLNQNLKGLGFVNSENHNGYKDLILHLVNEHHIRKLAFIGGPDGNPGAESNFIAYKEALDEAGIPFDPENVYLHGDWTYSAGYELAQKLFARKNRIPEAIVCVNDWVAMAAITVAVENKYKVPEDIKVIGFDEVASASLVIPSLTTLNTGSEKMGETAINMLIKKFNQEASDGKCSRALGKRVIKAYPVYRQSCGCCNEITEKQVWYSQHFNKEIDKNQRFASQLRHLEDSFIKNKNIGALTDNLQEFFEKRHTFEGDSFAILINEKVIESLKEQNMAPEKSKVFDKELMVMVNLRDGKQEKAKYLVQAKDLIPESLLSTEPSMYLFLPVFNQDYLHGYYVSKDFYGLLEDKSAYNWTRNLGTIIEKYRLTSIYKIIAEKYKVISTKDALSGLLNRAGLDTVITELFNKNREENINNLLIFIDINSMKTINDKYGHMYGDFAIKTVAECINNSIPEKFMAARYGGDEFVIVGAAENNVKTAVQIMDKIAHMLEEKKENLKLPFNLSVSCGGKVFTKDDCKTLAQAITAVDDLMYKKKQQFHKNNDIE